MRAANLAHRAAFTLRPEARHMFSLPTRRFSVVLALVGAACSGSADKKPDTASAASKQEAQMEARMREGTSLLYEKNDPFGAEQAFRDVLKMTPTHYGAHFQLARALDRQGKPADARLVWTDVLAAAESAKDTATAAMARTRLAAPDTVGVDAIMASGVNLLHVQNNPSLAAEQFRMVLAKNPTHYGATYQLALALDRTGKPADARRLWEKVLGMATASKDVQTAETARGRLKQNP